MADLARSAAEEYDLLVVVGGDGTLNEVLQGIRGDGPDVALVPRGTGRDFARTFGIGPGFDDAVRVALSGETRVLDLGLVAYRAWNGEDARSYFANVAGVGISGAIARRANEQTKAFGGRVSYLAAIVSVFWHWQVSGVELDVDGERRSGLMHEVFVANGAYLGGGLRMCPEADPSDGLFDVLALGHLTKRDLAFTLPKAYSGSHLPHPKAELLRGRVVTVDAEEPLPLQIDGEQPGTTPARFEVVPSALRLRVPAA